MSHPRERRLCYLESAERALFYHQDRLQPRLHLRGISWASPVGQQWRIFLQCQKCKFDPCVGKIPWRRKRQPTPVFLPGKSHGAWRAAVHGVAESRAWLSDRACMQLASQQLWEEEACGSLLRMPAPPRRPQFSELHACHHDVPFLLCVPSAFWRQIVSGVLGLLVECGRRFYLECDKKQECSLLSHRLYF